jgi:hypothetical protein
MVVKLSPKFLHFSKGTLPSAPGFPPSKVSRRLFASEVTYMKSALPLMAAVLIGFVLGAFSHLSLVKAASNTGPVNIQKVSDDVSNGSIRGSEFLGFACTQDDCYIASR